VEAEEHGGAARVQHVLTEVSSLLVAAAAEEIVATSPLAIHIFAGTQVGVYESTEVLVVVHAETCYYHFVRRKHDVLPEVQLLLAEFVD